MPDMPFLKLHSYYVRRVVHILIEAGARKVLEAGCGDGWNVAQMAASGLDVVGVDWSKNAIAYGTTLVPQARFYCGDVTDELLTKQFPNKFDAVAMVEVIEHIPPSDCVAALRNITSRLRTGGTLVMTTPHVNFPNNNPEHYRHFTPQLLSEMVEQVEGIKVTAVEGYGDVDADRAYWRKRRFVDNKLFTIKPLADRLAHRHDYTQPTPFDRCHGLILLSD
jgi:2-polyprenyl-3-methyl-5-hydroxy-6-metoxy-1,4-benzoquinol methylase